MVKITNNKEVKIVTKGAYDSFYKPLGFKLVEESTKKQEAKVEKIENKKSDEKIVVKEKDVVKNTKQSVKNK